MAQKSIGGKSNSFKTFKYKKSKTINNLLYFTMVARSSLRLTNLWLSDSRLSWNLEVLVSLERAKPEDPMKNSRSKDEN